MMPAPLTGTDLKLTRAALRIGATRYGLDGLAQRIGIGAKQINRYLSMHKTPTVSHRATLQLLLPRDIWNLAEAIKDLDDD